MNLLPPDKKREMRKGMILAQAQTMALVLFAASLIAALTLVFLKANLDGENEYVKAQAAAATAPEDAETMKAIDQVNAFLKSSDSLLRGSAPWEKVLIDLASRLPEGVAIDRFRTDRSGKIFLEGLATTRERALEMEDVLKSSRYLKEVKRPLSNIMQPTDVRFSFEMQLTALEALNQESFPEL